MIPTGIYRCHSLCCLHAGAVFLWLLEHGGGRMRRWRAPQITGKPAMLRRMPQHAAAPLSHTRTPHSTHHSCHTPPPPMHARDCHGGGVGGQPPPPHGQSTCPTTPHTSPTTHNTHASHACPHTATHTCTHTPPPAGHSDAARAHGGGRRGRLGGGDRLE